MKVISLNSGKKLIKGIAYDTSFFDNLPSGRKNICIDGYGWYQCSSFSLLDGSTLPEIQFGQRIKSTRTEVSDLSVGDIITCVRDNKFVHFIKDGKYRIKEIRIDDPKSSMQQYRVGSIKLEGYNRWIRWNNWSFRKLNVQESRDIKLSQIFDKEENFSISFKRKFEQKGNSDIILIETLAKSILDRYRNHYDIIDWGIEKSAKTYKLNRSDFDHLLDKPFSEILNIYENKLN